jgi:hypothetical protein
MNTRHMFKGVYWSAAMNEAAYVGLGPTGRIGVNSARRGESLLMIGLDPLSVAAFACGFITVSSGFSGSTTW